MSIGEPITILLVEDDDVDAEVAERGLRAARLANEVVRARDGEEALALLRGGGSGRIAQPYLILLDLDMPRMDGFELLAALRDDPDLRNATVFVLAASDSQRDKLASYRHHVAGYLVKSKIGRDFLEMVELVDRFWKVVQFPPDRLRVVEDGRACPSGE